MSIEPGVNSILLADCGTVMTKAVLLDRVAGQYRFVAQGAAPTTAGYPWGDVTAGIGHAVEHITEVTGRRFFEESGHIISPERGSRQGVDIFAATVSASEPLQVVLGGVVRDLSVASLQRAAAGTYTSVSEILAADGRDAVWDEEERVRRMRDAAPDVICVSGGTDGGASGPVLQLVEAATLAASLMDVPDPPHLLYAGNASLRERVAEIVNRQLELHVADNVRPTLADENLFGCTAELDALYVHNKMARVPGVAPLSGWSLVPLVPTARAFGRLIQYLWHLGDSSKGVLGIDVGGASTTLAAVFAGQLSVTVLADTGMVFGGERLLEEQGPSAITRWMPQTISDAEAQAMIANKQLHPATIPHEPNEQWLELALAREVIRQALRTARRGWRAGPAQRYRNLLPLCDTIVVSGGVLAHAPRPGQAALAVLDALQPIGITTLALDAHGLVPALGSLAAVSPLAAVEALDTGGLINLATVVAPVGHARRGDVVLSVHVTYDDGGSLNMEVRYGDIEVLPLLPGQYASLELRPLRRFDVGLGGPGRGGKRRVSGGLVGLVLDARGRPLALSSAPERRQRQVRNWLWDMGG